MSYVDGKPRCDGVASFLESRGIELPIGENSDGDEVQSVHSLGNRKDRYFLEHLKRDGVEIYESAIALVRKLRVEEIKTAVVSSSNNCAAVLGAAGIADLFDARVHGKEITALKLKGKPEPDAFLEAARRVGVEVARAVVVEDAIDGVAAGRAGRFGCVIGVDRSGHAQALHDGGADVVVTDPAQVGVAMESPSAWSLVFENFDPSQEGIREALCSLGNGYFATRPSEQWRMTFSIQELISRAATIVYGPISPVVWSRTKTSSIFAIGSRSTFGSTTGTGSIRERSNSCRIAMN